MSIKLFLTICCYLVTSTCLANTLYSTYVGDLVNGENIRIDWDSINQENFSQDRHKQYITAQIERHYNRKKRSESGLEYQIEKTLWYADCHRQRYDLSQISWHDKNGTVLQTATKPVVINTSENWKVFSSSGTVYDVHDWICWASEVKLNKDIP